MKGAYNRHEISTFGCTLNERPLAGSALKLNDFDEFFITRREIGPKL